jgi:hypothetical protein
MGRRRKAREELEGLGESATSEWLAEMGATMDNYDPKFTVEADVRRPA